MPGRTKSNPVLGCNPLIALIIAACLISCCVFMGVILGVLSSLTSREKDKTVPGNSPSRTSVVNAQPPPTPFSNWPTYKSANNPFGEGFGEMLEAVNQPRDAHYPTYRARLSLKDHFTHDGEDLRSLPGIQVRDILLQDRLNFHLYANGDQEDESDVHYAKVPILAYRDIYNIRQLRVIPEGAEGTIIFGTPLVEVTMEPFQIIVRIVE